MCSHSLFSQAWSHYFNDFLLFHQSLHATAACILPLFKIEPLKLVECTAPKNKHFVHFVIQ